LPPARLPTRVDTPIPPRLKNSLLPVPLRILSIRPTAAGWMWLLSTSRDILTSVLEPPEIIPLWPPAYWTTIQNSALPSALVPQRR